MEAGNLKFLLLLKQAGGVRREHRVENCWPHAKGFIRMATAVWSPEVRQLVLGWVRSFCS